MIAVTEATPAQNEILRAAFMSEHTRHSTVGLSYNELWRSVQLGHDDRIEVSLSCNGTSPAILKVDHIENGVFRWQALAEIRPPDTMWVDRHSVVRHARFAIVVDRDQFDLDAALTKLALMS